MTEQTCPTCGELVLALQTIVGPAALVQPCGHRVLVTRTPAGVVLESPTEPIRFSADDDGEPSS